MSPKPKSDRVSYGRAEAAMGHTTHRHCLDPNALREKPRCRSGLGLPGVIESRYRCEAVQPL